MNSSNIPLTDYAKPIAGVVLAQVKAAFTRNMQSFFGRDPGTSMIVEPVLKVFENTLQEVDSMVTTLVVPVQVQGGGVRSGQQQQFAGFGGVPGVVGVQSATASLPGFGGNPVGAFAQNTQNFSQPSQTGFGGGQPGFGGQGIPQQQQGGVGGDADGATSLVELGTCRVPGNQALPTGAKCGCEFKPRGGDIHLFCRAEAKNKAGKSGYYTCTKHNTRDKLDLGEGKGGKGKTAAAQSPLNNNQVVGLRTPANVPPGMGNMNAVGGLANAMGQQPYGAASNNQFNLLAGTQQPPQQGFGVPQAQSAFGVPPYQPQVSFGQPQVSFGQPQAAPAFGQPQAATSQFGFGQVPQAAPVFGVQQPMAANPNQSAQIFSTFSNTVGSIPQQQVQPSGANFNMGAAVAQPAQTALNAPGFGAAGGFGVQQQHQQIGLVGPTASNEEGSDDEDEESEHDEEPHDPPANINALAQLGLAQLGLAQLPPQQQQQQIPQQASAVGFGQPIAGGFGGGIPVQQIPQQTFGQAPAPVQQQPAATPNFLLGALATATTPAPSAAPLTPAGLLGNLAGPPVAAPVAI